MITRRAALASLIGIPLALGLRKGSAQTSLSISGTSGTWSHGGSVAISGSGFGNKIPAAPLVWDNCMHGQALSARWSGGWPTNASYAPDYRPVQRSQPMPHARTTKYLCCANFQDGGFDNGWNAMFFRSFSTIPGPYVFFSHRMRLDSSFNSGDNFKFIDYSCTGSPYCMDSSSRSNWYTEQSGGISGSSLSINVNDDGGSLRPWDGTNYWGDRESMASGPGPIGQWILLEGAWYLTSGNNGVIRYWQNGPLRFDYSATNPTYGGLVHPTDKYSGTDRCIGFGGYTRLYNTDNWRYFTDLYLDTTWARIVLGNASTYNACTVREPQIPSAWSDTSIQATVNLGAFGDTGTAYLYVVNAMGSVSQAFPVALGGGSALSAPDSPNNLIVR